MAKVALYIKPMAHARDRGSHIDNAPIAQALKKAGHEVFLIPNRSTLASFFKQHGHMDVFLYNGANESEREAVGRLYGKTRSDIVVFARGWIGQDPQQENIHFVSMPRNDLVTLGSRNVHAPQNHALLVRAVAEAAEKNKKRVVWGKRGRVITSLEWTRQILTEFAPLQKAKKLQRQAAHRAAKTRFAPTPSFSAESSLRRRRALLLRTKIYDSERVSPYQAGQLRFGACQPGF